MLIRRNECEAAGVDYEAVKRIAKKLSEAGRAARKLGITIFGGAGGGSLRIHDDPTNTQGRALVLADLDGRFDGGDGGCYEDDNGLMRGE